MQCVVVEARVCPCVCVCTLGYINQYISNLPLNTSGGRVVMRFQHILKAAIESRGMSTTRSLCFKDGRAPKRLGDPANLFALCQKKVFFLPQQPKLCAETSSF